MVRSYDLLRDRFGPAVPICLEGGSAGGQLALVLATLRPDVACVIAAGAPTDLLALRRQGAAEVDGGAASAGLRRGSAWIGGLARSAFGSGRLRRYSPARRAGTIRARVLLAAAASDTLVPWSQATRLAGAMRRSRPDAYVDIARLAEGSVAWVHASVSQDASDDLAGRVDRLVAPFGRAPVKFEAPVVPSKPSKLFGLPWFGRG